MVLSQQKDLTLQKTAEAKAKMLEADTALSEATNRIDRVEQQLAAIPKRIVTQSKQLPNQYSAERLNTMIVEMQNKRTQLLTKYRPDDRLVREVDEQIRTTRDALAHAEQKTSVEEATDLNPLRQTLEAELSRARLDQAGAKARRDTLAGQLQQYDASLKKLESNTAKHDDLQREKKEAEDNYQLYAKKREEARIADELDRQKITNVSIAEAATVSQLPSSPNRPVNLVLGIVLAGFLSLGCVFSAEMLSDAVHTPRQLEALTGATVLATVPENSRRVLLRNNRERFRSKRGHWPNCRAEHGPSRRTNGRKHRLMPELRMESNGHKQHNLQLLLASLQNGSPNLRGGAAIAFTAASQGNSANNVAQLFAVELARHTCRRTLIIDSQRLQGLGVEDYLQMPWNCHPTNIDNLWMLPARKQKKRNARDDHQELPKRSFLMRVPKDGEQIDTGLDSVDALRVSFDNILIDCGALKDSTDAAMLASRVDGVVIVVDAGQSRREEILNSQRMIEKSGGKFLGFVLNKRRYPVPEWLYKRL